MGQEGSKPVVASTLSPLSVTSPAGTGTNNNTASVWKRHATSLLNRATSMHRSTLAAGTSSSNNTERRSPLPSSISAYALPTQTTGSSIGKISTSNAASRPLPSLPAASRIIKPSISASVFGGGEDIVGVHKNNNNSRRPMAAGHATTVTKYYDDDDDDDDACGSEAATAAAVGDCSSLLSGVADSARGLMKSQSLPKCYDEDVDSRDLLAAGDTVDFGKVVMTENHHHDDCAVHTSLHAPTCENEVATRQESANGFEFIPSNVSSTSSASSRSTPHSSLDHHSHSDSDHSDSTSSDSDSEDDAASASSSTEPVTTKSPPLAGVPSGRARKAYSIAGPVHLSPHAIATATAAVIAAGTAAVGEKLHHKRRVYEKAAANRSISATTTNNKPSPPTAAETAEAATSVSSPASIASSRLQKQKDAADRRRRMSEQILQQHELRHEQQKAAKQLQQQNSVLSCEWEVVALDEAVRRATVMDGGAGFRTTSSTMVSNNNNNNAKKQKNGKKSISPSSVENHFNDEAGAAGNADVNIVPEYILPELIDAASSLFEAQPDLLVKLNAVLPSRAQGYPWHMMYNTAVHGFSLKSLFRSMQSLSEEMSYAAAPVCILMICDTDNNIFGAVLSQPLKVSDLFYGTGESLLFTFSPKFRHYMWSGENSFFVKGTKEALIIGASDGNFGLWLDGDLYHGRSQRCQTFDNDALVPGSGDFVIKAVEAWAIH